VELCVYSVGLCVTNNYTEFHRDIKESHREKNSKMEFNTITEKIIGCAIEVHKVLGPGLLESAYEECLTYELTKAGLKAERQKPVRVIYKEIHMECGYRIDILVEDTVIIELKTVEVFCPVHEAQILTYLKFSKKRIGLLVNFNVTVLKNGIKRYKM
jgi:GxxExxY protein